MKVYQCLISKETYTGGAWFYRVVFMGNELKRFDASNPRSLAQMLFEYFRNTGIEDDAQIDVSFPQELRACLSIGERGDSLFVPVRDIEARKILTEYVLFKSEVGQKDRQDARKVRPAKDGD